MHPAAIDNAAAGSSDAGGILNGDHDVESRAANGGSFAAAGVGGVGTGPGAGRVGGGSAGKQESPMAGRPEPGAAEADAGSVTPGDAGSENSTEREPLIPKATTTCPAFQSGAAHIMGVEVEIYAGPQSTGKMGPLVFYWHGGYGHGSHAVEGSPCSGIPDQVRAEILADGGIIFSPTTTTMKGQDVTLVVGTWYAPGDLELADLVVACAVEHHNIDPRRIYTTGSVQAA